MITETEIRDAAKKFKSINDAYWNAVGAQVKIIAEKEEYLKSKLHTPWARLRLDRHILAANRLARLLAVEYMVVAQNIPTIKAYDANSPDVLAIVKSRAEFMMSEAKAGRIDGDFVKFTATLGVPHMSFFGKAPLTLNQRLDQMGPQYREICGRLHRVVAVIEHAASSDPPVMSPANLDWVLEVIPAVAALLAEARKELGIYQSSGSAHGAS